MPHGFSALFRLELTQVLVSKEVGKPNTYPVDSAIQRLNNRGLEDRNWKGRFFSLYELNYSGTSI